MNLFWAFSFVLIASCPLALASCTKQLYKVYDPFLTGLSFANGSSNSVYVEYLPYNFRSDIVYSAYVANQFTISPEGNNKAVVLDLGTQEQIIQTYGIVPYAGVYYGIHYELQNGTMIVVVPKNTTTFQPLLPEHLIALNLTVSNPSFYPQTGHVYLIRIVGGAPTTYSLLAKLMVLQVAPDNSSVVIRWDLFYLYSPNVRGPFNCLISANSSQADAVFGGNNFVSYFPGWVINGENPIEYAKYTLPAWVPATLIVFAAVVAVHLFLIVQLWRKAHEYAQIQ